MLGGRVLSRQAPLQPKQDMCNARPLRSVRSKARESVCPPWCMYVRPTQAALMPTFFLLFRCCAGAPPTASVSSILLRCGLGLVLLFLSITARGAWALRTGSEASPRVRRSKGKSRVVHTIRPALLQSAVPVLRGMDSDSKSNHRHDDRSNALLWIASAYTIARSCAAHAAHHLPLAA